MAGGDVEEALKVLKSISEGKPYYIQAREKIANIYLTHHKDKAMYLSCYRELASRLPGSSTSLLLGEAYMNVGEVREGEREREEGEGERGVWEEEAYSCTCVHECWRGREGGKEGGRERKRGEQGGTMGGEAYINVAEGGRQGESTYKFSSKYAAQMSLM